MRQVYWLVIAAIALACSDQPELTNDDEPESETRTVLLTIEELPPIPAHPSARSGQLVVLSAGDYDIHGAWEGRAGICEDLGIMEIYAGPSGLGTAMLLRIPEGNQLGRYPVVAAAADFPDAPAALIAVQVFDSPDAHGFQGYSYADTGCPMPCREGVLELEPAEGGRRILMEGKGQFVVNTERDEIYSGTNVDRHVFQSPVPV